MRRFQFNDVSFEAPADWMDLSIITLAGSDSKTFQPNIVITREDAPAGSLKAYAHSQIPEVKRQVKSHELVSERAEKIGNADGYVLEHRMKTPEGHAVRQLQYFAKSGSDVIVISLTCAEQELKMRRKVLDGIVASMRIGS
jgi:hypothetical protein